METGYYFLTLMISVREAYHFALLLRGEDKELLKKHQDS